MILSSSSIMIHIALCLQEVLPFVKFTILHGVRSIRSVFLIRISWTLVTLLSTIMAFTRPIMGYITQCLKELMPFVHETSSFFDGVHSISLLILITTLRKFVIFFSYNVFFKVRKRAKISNHYNQAPHLAQDTNGNMTTSQ